VNKLQITSIVRDRGHLTIPDSIRKALNWVYAGSVVTMVQAKPDEITIKPYSTANKKTDWSKLWKDLKRVRSFKGKGESVNLSEFIIKDRETHF